MSATMQFGDREDPRARPTIRPADSGRPRPDGNRPADVLFAYDGSENLPYILAEGSMYFEAIIQAITDAGSPPPRANGRPATAATCMQHEIDDAIRFLYSPRDRRRYYIAAMADIEASMLDRMLAKLLDPGQMSIYTGRSGRVDPLLLDRLRERVRVFQSRRKPAV